MNKRIIAIIISAALFVLAIASSLFTSTVSSNFQKDFKELKSEGLQEKRVSGTDAGNRIARLELNGVIQDVAPSPFAAEGYNHKSFMESLEKIKKDNSIKGVLLVVNSPGGGVYESAEIYDKLKEIKAKGKKIYVSMKNMAASGGYYISAPADKIYASSETITGSLGVIMQGMNYKELADKYGVKFETIKSGAHKDIMSPTKEMDPEERKILQTMVDESYDQFVKVISEGRHKSDAQVRKLADGRIYSGKQAKANGLIDELGLEEDALKGLKKEIKSDKAEVIEFKNNTSIFGSNIFGAESLASKLMGSNDLNMVKELLAQRSGPLPMYLYGE